MKKLSICKIIFSLFISICFVSTVSAVENDGYYASEMIMNFQGKPGDTVTGSIRFFNDTSADAVSTFSMKDFTYDNNTITYEDDRPNSFSVQKWTALSVTDTEVESDGYIDIEVTVKIPEEAEQGEHMALFVGSFLPVENKDSEMKITTEIAPVVYVLVTDENGDVNLNKEWNLLDSTFDRMNGGYFIYSVENKGNVHLESQGKITLKNIFTNKTKEFEIPKVNLLPSNKKDILINWTLDDYFGIYKANVDFSMDGERFEKEEITLFIIPWVHFGVALGGIIVIVVFIRLYLKRLKKKWLDEAAKATHSSN